MAPRRVIRPILLCSVAGHAPHGAVGGLGAHRGAGLHGRGGNAHGLHGLSFCGLTGLLAITEISLRHFRRTRGEAPPGGAARKLPGKRVSLTSSLPGSPRFSRRTERAGPRPAPATRSEHRRARPPRNPRRSRPRRARAFPSCVPCPQPGVGESAESGAEQERGVRWRRTTSSGTPGLLSPAPCGARSSSGSRAST